MTFKEVWERAVEQSKRLQSEREIERQKELMSQAFSRIRSSDEECSVLKFPLNYVAYVWNRDNGKPVDEYFELFPNSQKPRMAVAELNRLYNTIKPDNGHNKLNNEIKKPDNGLDKPEKE